MRRSGRPCHSVPGVELAPRYDGPPLLRLDVTWSDPAVPLLRQRRRLAGALAGFDDEQWAAPTRCEGWSAKDVIVHLNTTNQFFAISIAKGLAGEPTRYLNGFDPVSSPAQLVDGLRGLDPDAVLETYLESVESLADVVSDLDEAAWACSAEAPPGHIAARAVALHGLWDAWVHERDILLPQGVTPAEEADEILQSFVYAVALGPALLASSGDDRHGVAVFEATDPTMSLVVELGPTVVVRELDGGPVPDGAVRVTGRTVDVLEALSYRSPLDAAIPPEQAWMFDGLAAAFDLT